MDDNLPFRDRAHGPGSGAVPSALPYQQALEQPELQHHRRDERNRKEITANIEKIKNEKTPSSLPSGLPFRRRLRRD